MSAFSMKTGTLSLLVGILVSLAVPSCSTQTDTAPAHEPQTKTIEVSYDDLQNQKFITRNITLPVGDTLKVILASNGSTGFSWTAEAQIGDPAVVQQTSHESVEPTTGLLGAWGKEIWTFKAMKAGATTIVADYGQPWEGGEQKVWTFTANVTAQ